MLVRDFLESVTERTRESLPDAYRNFKSRRRGSMIQIWYERPQIHYEVWVQGRRNRLEVGLHLEANKALNDRILRYLARQFIAVQAELGPEVEIEQWTQSWGRIHQFVAYDHLDDGLCDTVARDLGRMIVLLEPFLAEALC